MTENTTDGPVLSAVVSDAETGAGIQVEMAAAEEKKEAKKCESTGVAQKEEERVWRKALEVLLRYSLLNVFENLTASCGSYDSMEKFFGVAILMNALVYAMSSAMATAVSWEELKQWYDDCKDNAELRECLRKYGSGHKGNDVCSQQIRMFQTMITISHQLLAFSLFVSAGMYLYVMAFMKKTGDESEEDKAKEPVSVEQMAARKRQRQTGTLFSVVVVGEVLLTVGALICYQQAYQYMLSFKFMIFAWLKGEHCNSQNVRKLSSDMGVWLVSFGCFVVYSIVSLFLGLIHERPQTHN